jgi:hypothetical protein
MGLVVFRTFFFSLLARESEITGFLFVLFYDYAMLWFIVSADCFY